MPLQGISDQLREIAAHSGAEFKTDVVGFRVTIPTSGDVTQPSAEQLRGEYDYFVVEIRAAMTGSGGTNNASTEDGYVDDVQEIRFNLRESGTGQNVFSTDVELATLVDSRSGQPAHPLNFKGFGYKIRAGAHLQPTFTRRSSSISLARIVNLQLVCVLVPKNYQLVPSRQY